MSSNKRCRTRSVLPEDQPVSCASVSSLLYIAIATLYILVSGRIAASLAGSMEQLRTIEAFKGVAFVFATGLLFFVVSLGFWRRARHQRNLLVQSERKAVAAMYSATLAHDLNNLLMGLMGLVDTLKQQESGDDTLSLLRGSVEQSIQRLAPFAKRIASSATKLPLAEKVATDIPLLLNQTVDMVRKHPDVRFCSLTVDALPQVTLTLDRELFERALLNLVVNAAQAAGDNGRVRVAAERRDVSLAVEVHDSGPGIPPEKAEAIFNPGYTTKSAGIGLGLLTVQAFAASCHGKIEIERSPLGGALFRIVIPLSQEPVAAKPPVTP